MSTERGPNRGGVGHAEGGMGHTLVGWVIQGWGRSCRGGVGHAGMGWCGSCRGGVRWVIQRQDGLGHEKYWKNIKLLVLQGT